MRRPPRQSVGGRGETTLVRNESPGVRPPRPRGSPPSASPARSSSPREILQTDPLTQTSRRGSSTPPKPPKAKAKAKASNADNESLQELASEIFMFLAGSGALRGTLRRVDYEKTIATVELSQLMARVFHSRAFDQMDRARKGVVGRPAFYSFLVDAREETSKAKGVNDFLVQLRSLAGLLRAQRSAAEALDESPEAIQRTNQIFNLLDLDGRHVVSRREFDAFHSAMHVWCDPALLEGGILGGTRFDQFHICEHGLITHDAFIDAMRNLFEKLGEDGFLDLLGRQLAGWEQANRRKQHVHQELRRLQELVVKLQNATDKEAEALCADLAEGLFEVLDQDESGTINRQEMERLARILEEVNSEDSLFPCDFDVLDKDGDQVVSHEELLSFITEALKTFGRRRFLEQLSHVVYTLRQKVERREDASQRLDDALDAEAPLEEPHTHLLKLCHDVTLGTLHTSPEGIFQRLFYIASLGEAGAQSIFEETAMGGLWTLASLQPLGGWDPAILNQKLAHEFVLLPPSQGQPGSSPMTNVAAMRAFRSRRDWMPLDIAAITRAPLELMHPSTEISCTLRLGRKAVRASVTMRQLRDAAEGAARPGEKPPALLDLRHLLLDASSPVSGHSLWELRIKVQGKQIIAATFERVMGETRMDDESALGMACEQLHVHGLTLLKVAVSDGEYALKIADWPIGSKGKEMSTPVQFDFIDLQTRSQVDDAQGLYHRVLAGDGTEYVALDVSHPCLETPELVHGVGTYKLTAAGGDLPTALRSAEIVLVLGVGKDGRKGMGPVEIEELLRRDLDAGECVATLSLIPGWSVHLKGFKDACRRNTKTSNNELPQNALTFARQFGQVAALAERNARPGVPSRVEGATREAKFLVHRLHCALRQCPPNGPFSAQAIDLRSTQISLRRLQQLDDRLVSVGGSASVEAFVRCFDFERFDLGFLLAKYLLEKDPTLGSRGGTMAAEHIMSRDPPLPPDIHESALELLHEKGAHLDKLIVPAVQQHRPDEVVLLFEVCLGERGLQIKSKGFGNEPLRKKLIRAVQKGDIDEVTRIITHLKLNPNCRDRNGWTAAHHAASLGHIEILKALRKFKADLNTKNNDGAVALHYATNTAVHQLREWGCSVSVVDSHGMTPMMMAKKREAEYGQNAAAELEPKVQWSQIDAVIMSELQLTDKIRELVKLGFDEGPIFVITDAGKVVNPNDELQLRNQMFSKNGLARGRLLCTKLLCPLLTLAGQRELLDEPGLQKQSFCKYLLQQRIASYAPAEVFTCARMAAGHLEKLLDEEYDKPENRILHTFTKTPSVLMNSGQTWPMLHQKEAHGDISWLDLKDDLEALATLVEMELFETAEDLCDWGAGNFARDRLYVLYIRELAKRANPAYQKKMKAIVETFPQAEYCEGPLKAEKRMLVKGREDYAADAVRCYKERDLGVGGVVDVARLSICCENADVMCKVVERILETNFENDGLEVLRLKNGFHPDAESSGGYRDLKLTILVAVPGMEQENVRHVVECQLLLATYLQMKKFQHVLYEVERGDCFDTHGRLGVDIFRTLESHHDAEGLMMLVNAVDAGYRKTYARFKKETDAKIAEASRLAASSRVMELLEMEKQKEKLVPLEAEKDDAQAATEVFVMECLQASNALPPLEFDDWLSHVLSEAALSEIEAVVCRQVEPWQEGHDEAIRMSSDFMSTDASTWSKTNSSLGATTTSRARKKEVMKLTA